MQYCNERAHAALNWKKCAQFILTFDTIKEDRNKEKKNVDSESVPLWPLNSDLFLR